MGKLSRLDVKDLSLRRGPRILFQNLSFVVEAGAAVVLSGENGSGKTSLLRAIAGLIAPSYGEIRFLANGENIDANEAIRSHTHFMGHLDGLTGSRAARAEIEFATLWTGGNRESAIEAAEAMGLARLLDLPVRKLSAGQRRRLAMVRLIASPRRLWLLDEPNTALDASSRVWLSMTMEAHLAEGGLILAAAHDPLSIEATSVELGR